MCLSIVKTNHSFVCKHKHKFAHSYLPTYSLRIKITLYHFSYSEQYNMCKFYDDGYIVQA